MKTQTTPDIRFEGFDGEWKERKIGDCFSERTEHMIDGELLSVTLNDGIKRFSELNRHDSSNEDKSKYKKVCIGDIAYNSMRMWQGASGYSPYEGIVSPAYTVLVPNKNINSKCLAYQFKLQKLINIFQINSQGITSDTWNLKYPALSEIKMFIANKEEQTLLADYFSHLDSQISVQRRKVEKLRDFKAALLNKMFPKDGEAVPEIRFEGFTEPWEQRKFSDLVLIERGGSPRPIDAFITDNPNGLNWVKIGDAPEQGRYITKTAEKIRPEGLAKTREVHPGDLILSNSMSFGKPYIMGIDGCIHDGWLLIRDIQKRFDLKFLCHILGTEQMLNQYRSLAAGSTVNNLNKELVGNTTVTIPALEEQQVLGQYFENLDHLITLHQRKCDELQKIKKFMLQNMFL